MGASPNWWEGVHTAPDAQAIALAMGSAAGTAAAPANGGAANSGAANSGAAAANNGDGEGSSTDPIHIDLT